VADALLQKYIEDSRLLWEEGLNEGRYTGVGSVMIKTVATSLLLDLDFFTAL